MKINIGTKSPVKVKSIENTIKDYDIFKNVQIECLKVDSKVSDQPKTLKETIKGARNRARNAFINCEYSFGIESGIMAVPETKTGYMNVSVCAIFDGNLYHLGIASCFEYPKEVTRLALEEGLEMSEAFRVAGLTDKNKIGYSEGGIGLLTKGRFCSEEYYKHSVVNALIHLENPELY